MLVYVVGKEMDRDLAKRYADWFFLAPLTAERLHNRVRNDYAFLTGRVIVVLDRNPRNDLSLPVLDAHTLPDMPDIRGVETYRRGEDAIKAYKKDPSFYELAVVPAEARDMHGIEVARQLRLAGIAHRRLGHMRWRREQEAYNRAVASGGGEN